MARGSGTNLAVATRTSGGVDRGAAAEELQDLAALDPERLATEIARLFPEALTEALREATAPARAGGHWWESCDRVELRRPVAWRQGTLLFLIARYRRGGQAADWFLSSAAFEVGADELVQLAERLEAGRSARLAPRHPLVAFIKSEPL